MEKESNILETNNGLYEKSSGRKIISPLDIGVNKLFVLGTTDPDPSNFIGGLARHSLVIAPTLEEALTISSGDTCGTEVDMSRPVDLGWVY